MKSNFQILVLLFFSIFFASCQTSPVTGRSQIKFYSKEKMLNISKEQYAKVIKKSKLSQNKQDVERLRRVGNRITAATDQYLKEMKMPNKFDWQFNLIEDKQVNAWAMPGGQIAFYTGILPLMEDDDSMAVVMGHEIAHAIAEHGNERMSQAMLVKGGMLAAGVGLRVSDKVKNHEANAILIATGALASLGYTLPHSRKHELEADYLGLLLMAKAGYNPERAVSFWKKMSNVGKGKKPPELLSTHPSDQRRIDEIKKILPKVMKHYKPVQTQNTSQKSSPKKNLETQQNDKALAPNSGNYELAPKSKSTSSQNKNSLPPKNNDLAPSTGDPSLAPQGL